MSKIIRYLVVVAAFLKSPYDAAAALRRPYACPCLPLLLSTTRLCHLGGEKPLPPRRGEREATDGLGIYRNLSYKERGWANKTNKPIKPKYTEPTNPINLRIQGYEFLEIGGYFEK